jgi:predicted enzyme related to lactoylglutathione lyase
MGQPVIRWQILSRTPDLLTEFYSRLFGWETDTDNALGYRMIDTGSARGIHGGVWPIGTEGRPMVSLYVEVDDVAEQVRHAVELGATVVMPQQKLPDGEELAIIADPEGLPFGLVKPARARPAEGVTLET